MYQVIVKAKNHSGTEIMKFTCQQTMDLTIKVWNLQDRIIKIIKPC